MKQIREEKLTDIKRKATSYLKKELQDATDQEIYATLTAICGEFGFKMSTEEIIPNWDLPGGVGG